MRLLATGPSDARHSDASVVCSAAVSRWRNQGQAALASVVWLLFALGLVAACAGPAPVVRVVDGSEQPGRYIDDQAYASFLAGSMAESQGHFRQAEHSYYAAWQADPNGLEPLVRLAAVRCAQGHTAQGLKTVQLALDREPSLATGHLERARCLIRAGEAASAVESAHNAVMLDPRDEQATITLALAYEACGDLDAAFRVLHGMTLWVPGAITVWKELQSMATRHGRTELAQWAQSKVGRALQQEPLYWRRLSIDQLLGQGALPRAREKAADAGLTQTDLAVRAALVGLWQVAHEQARWVLAADPSNADAAAVWWSLPPSMIESQPAPTPQGRPSVPAALLLEQALRHRVGNDAAAAYAKAYGPHPLDDDDPLVPLLRDLAAYAAD